MFDANLYENMGFVTIGIGLVLLVMLFAIVYSLKQNLEAFNRERANEYEDHQKADVLDPLHEMQSKNYDAYDEPTFFRLGIALPEETEKLPQPISA